MDKKEKDNIIITSMIIILLILFSLGLIKTYEKGYIEGARVVCGDLELGIDNFGNYVCYNKTVYDKQNNLLFNLDLGGIE